MRLWYAICILFFIYNIQILVQNRYEVVYQLEDSKSNTVKYAYSFDLIKNKKNLNISTDQINLDELHLKLVNYFENLKIRFYFSSMFKKHFLEPVIKQQNYFIHKDHLFFVIPENLINDLDSMDFFNQNCKIYAFDCEKFSFIQIQKKEFKYLDDDRFGIHQMVLINKEYPYSNCLSNYSKFNCTNTCFKRYAKLSRYHYNAKENETIDLYYEMNDEIKLNEMKCFKKCDKESCKNSFILKEDKHKNTILMAVPLYSNSDYWWQLIGLIISLINVSFYELFLRFFKFSKLKFQSKFERRFTKLKKCIFIFEFFILCLSLAFASLIVIDMAKTYKEKKENPIIKHVQFRSVGSKSYSIVICVPIEQPTFWTVNNFNNEKLINLEKISANVFNETIEEVYMDFFGKKEKINLININDFVVFKQPSMKIFGLTRCFLIKISDVFNRQNFLPASRDINIVFKHPYSDVYLIPEEVSFDSKSLLTKTNVQFIKKQISRTVKTTNCTDYEQYEDSDYTKNQLKFKKRSEFIDFCTAKEFIKKFKQASFLSIINKNHFNESEWSNLSIIDDIDDLNHEQELKKIKVKCTEKFALNDCNQLHFERIDSNDLTSFDSSLIIDENYVIIKDIEEEQTTLMKLIYELLNVQSILFGLNLMKIFLSIYFFLKIKFNFKDLKIFLLPIYLICLTGLAIHFYFLFSQVINGDFVYREYYQLTWKIPRIVFCFEYNQNLIDENYKLNGHYLEKFTNEIRPEIIFNKISYLNLSSEWIDLKLNFTNDEFKIETLFFINKKCLSIELQSKYSENQFLFADEVLRINFNETLVRQEMKDVYFFTHLEDTIEISRINHLNKLKERYSKFLYSITHDQFEVVRDDQFFIFKSPLSWFIGQYYLYDLDKYVNEISQNLDLILGIKTLNFPLGKKNFNFSIDEELFDQFYSQFQTKLDLNKSPNKNYQRKFSSNNLIEEKIPSYKLNQTDKPDFEFKILPLKKKLLITNDMNLIELLISILNILSLYLNLSVLDLYVYLYKIQIIFILLYKMLLKIQTMLNFQIKNSIKTIDKNQEKSKMFQQGPLTYLLKIFLNLCLIPEICEK